MEEKQSMEKLVERVGQLEFDLAHQQRLVEQLNEVVTEQTMQLTRYARILPDLQNQVRELKQLLSASQAPPADEKPPHY